MISVLVLSTAARLAAATATATATNRGRVVSGRGEVGLRLNATLTTATLVGLLRHLEDLAELHPLVRLHRLLNVSEPLVCHFV